MNKLFIATVSAVALLGTAAFAAETKGGYHGGHHGGHMGNQGTFPGGGATRGEFPGGQNGGGQNGGGQNGGGQNGGGSK
jgi:opacity protein-like surface antigen